MGPVQIRGAWRQRLGRGKGGDFGWQVLVGQEVEGAPGNVLVLGRQDGPNRETGRFDLLQHPLPKLDAGQVFFQIAGKLRLIRQPVDVPRPLRWKVGFVGAQLAHEEPAIDAPLGALVKRLAVVLHGVADALGAQVQEVELPPKRPAFRRAVVRLVGLGPGKLPRQAVGMKLAPELIQQVFQVNLGDGHVLRLHELVGYPALPPPEQVQVHLVLFVGRGEVAQRLFDGPLEVGHRGRLVEHDDGLHKLLLRKGRQGVEYLHRGGQGLAGGRGSQRDQLLQGFGGAQGRHRRAAGWGGSLGQRWPSGGGPAGCAVGPTAASATSRPRPGASSTSRCCSSTTPPAVWCSGGA